MKEKRWLTCEEPLALLEHLGKTDLWTSRKVRLLVMFFRLVSLLRQ